MREGWDVVSRKVDSTVKVKASDESDPKASDVRITPAWLLDMVRAFAGGEIALDVCTEADNPTRARIFYALSQGTNGLTQPWAFEAQGGQCWGNVPYSVGQVAQWAAKAVREARVGAEILLLTKDDCRTKWNAYLRENADARCRIARGVGFLEPDGNGGYAQLVGPRWGECLWYFGRRRRRFARVFGAIGEVIHGLGPLEAA